MSINNSAAKVLIITARADYGGGPEHVYKLIQSLNKDVNFFVACPKDIPYWQRYSEIISESNLLEIPHRKFSLKYLFVLRKYVRDKDINIIHSHGKGAGIYSRPLALLTGISCLHSFHGVHIGRYGILKIYIYIWIERILGLFTKKILAVSKGEYDLIKEYSIAPDKKLTMIPNGVNIPEKGVDEDVCNKNVRNIVSISREDFAKNPDLLIDIINCLVTVYNQKKYIMIVLGPGLKGAGFEKKVNDAGLKNYFKITGTVRDTQHYLKEAFCYLSTSRSEGMPLGILEAMSLGIPVIATNVVGNMDLVRDNITGLLYDIERPQEAAAAILRLVDDSALWKSMSNAARSVIINNYSLEKMASGIHKEYIKLLTDVTQKCHNYN
ncbi:MAG: glycosyltransferase [Ignavibacteria bacterium]